MTEQLLQFIWRFRFFNTDDLKTAAGESLSIIHPGVHNTNQGPDFLNAKIKCGDMLLAGNIEIHIRASEWAFHRHSEDKNYNNVILHVVYEEDKKLGLNFPVLELRNRISGIMLSKYEQLMHAKHFIPCEAHIGSVNELHLIAWKERLLVERLQEKSAYVQTLLRKNNFHWEEVFWQMLAANFGSKINSDAFENMAVSLPVKILAKHRSQRIQPEALLMGQCGLLEKEFKDDYAVMLQKEYRFLRKKFDLQQPHSRVYFLRMRPANFPTLRLSQLAALLHESDHLFSKIKEAEDMNAVMNLFNISANDYWHYHYSFDEPSPFKHKNLGAAMTLNIMINTVLPVLYAYGWYNSSPVYQQKAVAWAAQLKAEQNSVTKRFEKLKLQNKTATDSQALLQLKNKYCDAKRCLECAIGNKILKMES